MSDLRTASGSLPPQQFKYTPFENARSIRILTLHPSTDSRAPLRGDLAVQSLDDFHHGDGSAPPYEAISYVWGDSRRTASLLCNSSALNITQSIHDALVRIRLPDAPRRLWADQVCINQEDVAERSRQVDLMNLVYKNATQVLVWLGPDDEEVAEEAVRMISHLHGVFTDEETHAIFRKAHTEDLSKQDPTPWRPLAKLSMLPWVWPTLPSVMFLHLVLTSMCSFTAYGLRRKSALGPQQHFSGVQPSWTGICSQTWSAC